MQQKILEIQERLAVAIEVDQSKDAAILRFHDAWDKVAARLESLKKDKLYLERDLQELQGKSARDLADAAKVNSFNLNHLSPNFIIKFFYRK